MTATRVYQTLRFTLFIMIATVAFFIFATPASAATDAYDPVTAVFGPTIANVPWEYVPDWYKTELAASGYIVPMMTVPEGYDPVTAVFGPTIVNVPWEYVPDWYKSELLASGFRLGSTQSLAAGGDSVSASPDDVTLIGKESFGTIVDLDAIDAERWGDQTSDTSGATEARTSLISETGFFFIGVALIFLALMIASFLKTRRQRGAV
jgi:hypothetical protein